MNLISSLTKLPEILIVDDVPENLRLIANLLTEQQFDVRKATNGEMALRSVQSQPPDLILLDINLPDIDGYEVCQRLKQSTRSRSIPVIFLSALDDVLDKVKAFQVGGVDYVTKPFQIEEVLMRIKTQLTLSQLTHQLEQQVADRTAELSQAFDHLKQTQLQLVQYEKMSALGNLVAGIAHEINNPIGFLSGNLPPILDYMQSLFELIHLYQQKYPNPDPDIQSLIASIDLDYIYEDFPSLIESMEIGVDRLYQISTSLRTFSRSDHDCKRLFNLHEGLHSTVLILKHRLKANEHHPGIEIITKYNDLPEIECFPGQLNQVFMNLLSNAIDALEESNQGKSFEEIEACPNQITIQTEYNHAVTIRIRDNGIGMTAATQQKIFEFLFTTKPVGKGTGLGLAIARQIIEEKHGGTIEVNSAIGQGTEFVITLPVQNTAPNGVRLATSSFPSLYPHLPHKVPETESRR